MDTEIKQKYPFLRKYGWILAVAILITGALIWAFISAGTTSFRSDSSSIVIGTTTKGEFNDYLRLNGKVETATIVQISALETGIVESKAVEEGAMVKSGDIILTLHNPLLRQQILDSESQLAEKQNMLRDTEIAMEKERLQLKQDLLAAKTDLNRKSRIAGQKETLYKEQLTSREEYLQAKEDLQLAKESLGLIENRIRQDSLYRSVQIAMMRESLHNMQENFALVRQRADNLHVRASHSGQLGSLTAELGQNIASGQQIGQLNILGDFKLAVNIDEHYIDRVVPGLKGTVKRQNRIFSVTVSKVYPEVSNNQFRADLIIDDAEGQNIRVGQNFTVDLQLGESVEAVMVPRGSFYQSTGGHWVYVLDKDGKTAVKRNITIGRQNPRYYEVLEGLEPGERIITSSYSDFGDAEKIIIND